jgi:hypothetical protein
VGVVRGTVYDVVVTKLYSSTNNRIIIEETDEIYRFPSSLVRVGQDNVITVIQVCFLNTNLHYGCLTSTSRTTWDWTSRAVSAGFRICWPCSLRQHQIIRTRRNLREVSADSHSMTVTYTPGRCKAKLAGIKSEAPSLHWVPS